MAFRYEENGISVVVWGAGKNWCAGLCIEILRPFYQLPKLVLGRLRGRLRGRLLGQLLWLLLNRLPTKKT